MKAKVISTGEIVEVKKAISIVGARGMFQALNGNRYHCDELEFIEGKDEKPIDWEQRRYEIAKEIYMHRIKNSLCNVKDDAEAAVLWADYLIEELQKGGRS